MNQLTKNIIMTAGDEGKQWLDSLPSLVAACAKKWNLVDFSPFKNLSYNYVLLGRRQEDGRNIVLKLSFFKEELKQEAIALKTFNGNGCVRLLDFDIDKGALLLEQVSPGVSLKSLFPTHDDAAVIHTAQVMQQLHAQRVIDTTAFPTIETWLRALRLTKNSLLPIKHLEQAQKLTTDLLFSQGPPVLLHGDLHHDNVLSSANGEWLAIDPKGVIGEFAYEVGAFIRNPIPELLKQSDPSKIISSRLTLFADLLAINKQRLKDWSYVQAILAACWATENDGVWQQWLQCAELIDDTKI